MLSMSYRIYIGILSWTWTKTINLTKLVSSSTTHHVSAYICLPYISTSQSSIVHNPSLKRKTQPLSYWVSPTKCAASVSAKAFLSCCELSRAKRNLHRRGDQAATEGVKKSDQNLWGNKNIALQKKNMRNYVENTYFSRNLPHESVFMCFFFKLL